MRYTLAGLFVASLALFASAAPQAGQATRNAAAQQLPPLSYICPMVGDEDVVEDKPGQCPKCKMELQAVRLDAKYWCPVHQGLEVHDGPGKCRRDGRELIPVTLALTWTCADAPDKPLLEPGNCSSGQARKINYALRAHGDHNPKHGGQFFMAADAWHHLEGTYPQNGLFRVWFYDNFTKPMPVKGFTGTLAIRDASDKEIASRTARARTRPHDDGSEGPGGERRLPAPRDAEDEVERQAGRTAVRLPVQRALEGAAARTGRDSSAGHDHAADDSGDSGCAGGASAGRDR